MHIYIILYTSICRGQLDNSVPEMRKHIYIYICIYTHVYIYIYIYIYMYLLFSIDICIYYVFVHIYMYNTSKLQGYSIKYRAQNTKYRVLNNVQMVGCIVQNMEHTLQSIGYNCTAYRIQIILGVYILVIILACMR